jgi:hypothetical protein
MPAKTLIGQATAVEFSLLDGVTVLSRVDSGAKTSSIWASHIYEASDGLHVVFFGKESEHYSGKEIIFPEYEETIVVSSNGHAEKRFKVKLSTRIEKRRIRASFTLADRSTQTYPVLLGRNLLQGKFIVDVSLGKEFVIERDKVLYKVLHGPHDIKRKQS